MDVQLRSPPDFAFGVLKTEEVGLLVVAALLLVNEVQAAAVKCVEPFLPTDVPQVGVVTAEVDPQHAQMVAVLGALHCGRNSTPLFWPLPDDLVVGCDQAAAFTFRFVVR
jgi:hypothetical protein